MVSAELQATAERINFFKFCRIMMEQANVPFAAAFRQQWDAKYPATPWDDSIRSRLRYVYGSVRFVDLDTCHVTSGETVVSGTSGDWRVWLDQLPGTGHSDVVLLDGSMYKVEPNSSSATGFR